MNRKNSVVDSKVQNEISLLRQEVGSLSKKLQRIASVLTEPEVSFKLSDIGLSFRYVNALNAEGIRTTDDIKKFIKENNGYSQSLKKVPFFGPKAFNELKEKLEEKYIFL